MTDATYEVTALRDNRLLRKRDPSLLARREDQDDIEAVDNICVHVPCILSDCCDACHRESVEPPATHMRLQSMPLFNADLYAGEMVRN